MKKSILTSAAVIFIGLATFAQDNGKCTKKCNTGDGRTTAKTAAADKQTAGNEWLYGLKCSSRNVACQGDGKKTNQKQPAKARTVK